MAKKAVLKYIRIFMVLQCSCYQVLIIKLNQFSKKKVLLFPIITGIIGAKKHLFDDLSIRLALTIAVVKHFRE